LRFLSFIDQMGVYKLTRQQKIFAPMEIVWDFFSSARNLSVLTPPYMRLTVLTEDLPAHIYPGQIITYNVSPLFNIPLFWMTEITHVAKYSFFIDEQRRGPYKLWHHEHHFIEEKDHVLMKDLVYYQLPGFFIGKLAHNLFIHKQLEDLFNYRHRKIEYILNNNISEDTLK
jgi:ligand-binding SRPBCC domain-containing protein